MKKDKDVLLNELTELRLSDGYTQEQELKILIELGYIDDVLAIFKNQNKDDDLMYYYLCSSIAFHDDTTQFTKAYIERFKDNSLAIFELLKQCLINKNIKCFDLILEKKPVFHVADKCHHINMDTSLETHSIYKILFNHANEYTESEFCSILKKIIIHDDLFVQYFYGNEYINTLINTNEVLNLRKRLLKERFEKTLELIESETDLFEPYFDYVRLVNTSEIETPSYFNDCNLNSKAIPVFDWLFELGFDVASCYYNKATYMHTFDNDIVDYFYTLPRAVINYSEMANLMDEYDRPITEIKEKIFKTAVKYRCLPGLGTKWDDVSEKILFNLKMQLKSLREPQKAKQSKVSKI